MGETKPTVTEKFTAAYGEQLRVWVEERIPMMELMGCDLCHEKGLPYEVWLGDKLLARSYWSSQLAWEVAWQQLNKSTS